MKVKCKKILNPTSLEFVEKHSSITIDKIYPVVEIFSIKDMKISIRIHDDTGTPSLWDIQMFETVDEKIPSNWFCQISNGKIILGPQFVFFNNFWDDFFDGQYEARQAYSLWLETTKINQQKSGDLEFS